jgi:hypothetical protein
MMRDATQRDITRQILDAPQSADQARPSLRL